MSKLQYFIKGNNKIAYRYYKRSKKNLIFIHGLMSDMNGQKSVFFNNYCRKENISFLCFDFSGHGKSNGDCINFGIKDWYKNLKDFIAIVNRANLRGETSIRLSIDIANGVESELAQLLLELKESDKDKNITLDGGQFQS